MKFSYGEGQLTQKRKELCGQIMLDDHKLYLVNAHNEEMTDSFIPLEKIKEIRKKWSSLEMKIELSAIRRTRAVLKGERKYLADLLSDLVKRRGLKKNLLRSKWVEPSG